MRARVIFESMFGNSELVARAVADGLRSRAEVEVVDDATHDLNGVDLLVLGGPTHVHGLSRAATREGCSERPIRPRGCNAPDCGNGWSYSVRHGLRCRLRC